MIRMLVSVRSVAEARVAAAGGADFIDLKEPGQGALGGLPIATIGEIVAALRKSGSTLPVSATIGDLPMGAIDEILARVAAVAASGVDLVKVGITREPGACAVLEALAATGTAIVPVFIADAGLDEALVALAGSLRFAGLMADTADKHAGSLFDALDTDTLQRFVAAAREAGTTVGLAGALRVADLPRLVALAPDFAGFRSAVCIGSRSDALDAVRLQALAAALGSLQAPMPRPTPSSSSRMRASSLL